MGERREGARQPLQEHTHHASQEGRQEARQEDHQGWRRQAPEGQDRVLQDLHLQGAQAGPPRDRDLLQGDVHHELLHQRHLREDRVRGRPPGALRTRSPPSPPGRSRRPCASSSPGSWPSTPCPRGPRRSPSTPPPLKQAGPLSHRSTPLTPLRARKKKTKKHKRGKKIPPPPLKKKKKKKKKK